MCTCKLDTQLPHSRIQLLLLGLPAPVLGDSVISLVAGGYLRKVWALVYTCLHHLSSVPLQPPPDMTPGVWSTSQSQGMCESPGSLDVLGRLPSSEPIPHEIVLPVWSPRPMQAGPAQPPLHFFSSPVPTNHLLPATVAAVTTALRGGSCRTHTLQTRKGDWERWTVSRKPQPAVLAPERSGCPSAAGFPAKGTASPLPGTARAAGRLCAPGAGPVLLSGPLTAAALVFSATSVRRP